MANDYTAKAIIETAQATKDLTALGNAATTAGGTFKILDEQLKKSNTSLKDAAAALKSVVESTRQGAIAAKALADAEHKQAQASGTAAKNEANLALANQRTATSASQGALAETRKALALEASTRAAQRATEATERHTASGQRAAASAQTRAAAEQRAAQASLEVTDHLSNSRYLLYDVAATYQMLSTAMLAIPAAATAVAISYERDMAQVIRTNDAIWGSNDAIGAMKDGLKDLATEIPTSFGELANIASIGGQLGIASSEMLKFTETVAKFGAASNVTTEQAATAFGRLQNAFPKDAKSADFFNKIGSSIAYVGVKSVATETEIIAVANQLSALAAQSGFTSAQVVGLSGALASVRIRPELARGAFLSTMTKMTNAAQEGATAFETYSKYLGMTGAEGKQLFETNPGEFFNQFIQGIGGAIKHGTAFSSVMSDLGVKEKRETQFLLGLANGADVTAEAFKNAGDAYAEGTFLDDSTARVFTTVSAELQKLANGFKNLGDTLGGGSMNLFAEFLRLISGAVKGISDLAASNKGVLIFINGLLGVGAVVGVLLAFKAAQAAALAAVVAFRQVVGSGITASISFSGVLKELATTMYMARGATLGHAQSMVANTGAMRAMMGAALGAAPAVAATGAAATGATGRIAGMAGALRTAGSSMLGLVGGPIGALVLGIGLIAAGFFAAGAEAKQAGRDIAEGMSAGVEEGRKAAAEQLDKLNVGVFNKDTSSSQFTDMGKSLNELADQAGVARSKMIDFATGVSGSEAALKKTFDEIAIGKDYLDFADWDDNGEQAFDAHLNNLRDIRDGLVSLKADSEKGTDNLKKNAAAVADVGDASKQATPAVDENGDMIGKVGEEADDSTKKLTGFIDTLFSLVNAEGAAAASLEKLGAGLAESTSFSSQDDGGRDNLANLQETLRNAALLEQQMVDSGQQRIQQAQANYVAFVDGLYADLAARGVDPAEIQMQVDRAKSIFNSAVTDANANDAAAIAISVDVDGTSLENAKIYLAQIKNEFGTIDATVLASMVGGEAVSQEVLAMQALITQVTGQPYDVWLAAQTDDAVNDVISTQQVAYAVTDADYTMGVDADTTAAVTAFQSLQQWAAGIMNSIIDGLNSVGNFARKLQGREGSDSISHVGWGQAAAPAQVAAPKAARANPVVAPAKSNVGKTVDPSAGVAKGLDNVAKGYDKAAKAAGGAGGAGEKAGKDMKDGIDSAKESLDDYVSRLKSGLSEAYDRQYGMASATDNYYKALNDINDKRKEDLKSIKDLITAQKELNNERNKDLVDANKAKIEKNISIKYGETDRAADYANQEQIALGNAAAKQKDIEANILNRKTLELGMNALTGYSNAAIANRAALRDLESKMLDMITAYAATGKSQQQVAAYAAALGTKFKQQTGDIGYNRTAVNNLQGSMQRYINTVNSVPRTKVTTATANTAGAVGAANGLRNAINSIPAYKSSKVDLVVNSKTVYTDADYRRVNDQKSRGRQLPFYKGGQVPGFAGGGQVPGQSPSNPNEDNRFARVDGKGLIGIRSKEWIVQEPAVNYYGNDFMNDINNMRLPKFAAGGVPAGYSTGAGQASGDMIVALDAATMAKFAQFMNQPTNLYTSNELIASSAHEGGKILASKGVRW